MRLYDFKCPKCGHEVEKIVETNPREDVLCEDCSWHTGAAVFMERMPPIFNINRGPVPSVGYYDDNLECGIRTNTHRKEVMREKGVSERGETPKTGEAWV